MSTVSAATPTSERRPWRPVVAGAAAVLAMALLATMLWAMARVIWFVQTSAYCASNTCTGSAMDAVGTNTDLMIHGEDALRSAGVSDVSLALSYLPMTGYALGLVIVLIGVAALAWGWSPRMWRRQWNAAAATFPVAVAKAALWALGMFVVVYLVNWESMLWVTHVTE